MARFIYTGILVSNLERSIKFYKSKFGMELLFKSKIRETGGEVAWLKSPESKQILELNWYPKNYTFGGRSGLDHLAFQVDDTYKYFGKFSKKEKTRMKPFVEGNWVLAYVKDPDGNWIEIGHRIKKR